MKSTQGSLVTTFRARCTSQAASCFQIPGDIGTAIYLERLEFKALATTSAGFAFFAQQTRWRRFPRDEMLAHIREIVKATPLPVNADFHGGYADEPEDCRDECATLRRNRRWPGLFHRGQYWA